MENKNRYHGIVGSGIIILVMISSIIFWDFTKYISVPVLILSALIFRKKDELNKFFASKLNNLFGQMINFLYVISAINSLIFVSEYINVGDFFNSFISMFLGFSLIFLPFLIAPETEDDDDLMLYSFFAFSYGLIYLSIISLDYISINILLGVFLIFILFYLLYKPLIWIFFNVQILEYFTALFFFSFSFVIPVSYEHSNENKVVHSEVDIEKIEDTISVKIDNYFDSLKVNNVIPNDFEPQFTLEKKIENNKNILIANYSYKAKINSELETEIYDYCSGCYLYTKSVAAKKMMEIVDITIRDFLLENIQNSEKVFIMLRGFTDGTIYQNPTPYKGDLGNFPIVFENDNKTLSTYFLNDEPTTLELKKDDNMDNAKLAFLRAYNMKEYFDQKIYLLNNAKDVSFGFYAYTQSDPTLNSGYYRKVSIGIKIFGDETEEVEEQDTKIGDIELWKWLLGLLAVLLTTIFIKPIELHYKRWREKEDEQKPYEKDRRLFFLFITLTLIVLFAILYVIFILL